MKVCVDLGATNIKSGLVKGETLLKVASTPTDTSHGLQGIVASLKGAIDPFMSEEVRAVCVSSAGKIDEKTGKVIFATENLPEYTGFDICGFIKQTYGLPSVAINDGLAALLGEIAITEEYKTKRMVMLTFGSGVGGAYAVNGEIKADESNDHAHFGHYIIEENGLACNCGKRGCAEQYLSGRAINRFAAEAGIEKDRIFAYVAAGDERAQAIFLRLKGYLVKTLAKIQETSPFDICLLGGGVVDGMGDTLEEFAAGLGYDVRRAKAGNAAGMLGANYFGRSLL
ncbi:MAG: ROK family protein [Clostridia bacterium]|nr:ROK family protein [Clostridia bacterium]